MYDELFENYIVAECLKRELHRKTHAALYFFRSSTGNDVDLIIDRKTSKEMIEIKSSETFRPKMIKPMHELIQANDHGYLLYRGKKIPYAENLDVINYRSYFDHSM